MRRAAVTAVGHYLPEDRLTNEELSQLVDTNDEWIRTRTGIIERRILRDKSKASAFMAIEAGKELLAKRGIAAEELDVIIIATITQDMLVPSTACLVQTGLGAVNAWGFDLNAACCGFLFALNTAASFVESGRYEKVLVVGTDKMSTLVDFTDRSTCVLFGDGAGAVLVEADEEGYGVIDSALYCKADNWEALCIRGGGSLYPPSEATLADGIHYLYQDGRVVFRIAVEGMADVASEVMKRNGLNGDDVRYLVPHQANQRIIRAVARRMGVSMDGVMLNISRYGNTTAATIPLCLHDWERELRKGDNLIVAAFGGGYTWGATYLRWAYDGSAVAAGESPLQSAPTAT